MPTLNPQLETLIQEGCCLLSTLEKPKITSVARKLGVPYHTLRNLFLGKHKSALNAHKSQQLLSPEQENVLVDWIIHFSRHGHPLSKCTFRKVARDLCGKKPSWQWIPFFLARHPTLKLGKPTGLDPKRGQAFNRTIVVCHFDLLEKFLNKKGIPWENVYNMDEKGCQRGGRHKLSAWKYFVPRGRQSNYKVRSGNLELVTIIECVCADGTNLLPGFVFQGKEFMPEWFEVDPRIW